MSGTFELVAVDVGTLRVALLSGDGEVLAVSVPFPDTAAAVAGIASVREIAGTGFIVDRTAVHSPAVPRTGAPCRQQHPSRKTATKVPSVSGGCIGERSKPSS